MESKNNLHVYHGSDWAEHEDYLVGNKEGLEKLKLAIDEALENEVSDIDAGEFIGVKCLSNEFFDGNIQSGDTKTEIIGWLMFAGLLFIFGTGALTIFKWFIGNA